MQPLQQGAWHYTCRKTKASTQEDIVNTFKEHAIEMNDEDIKEEKNMKVTVL